MISTNDLGEITCGKNFALQRAKCKKAVDRSLPIAYGNGFSWQGAGLEQNDLKQLVIEGRGRFLREATDGESH